MRYFMSSHIYAQYLKFSLFYAKKDQVSALLGFFSSNSDALVQL